MCNICQELAGWCRAFTRTERLLTLLECILLVVLIGFLTFLILHLIACPKRDTNREISHLVTTTPTINIPPTEAVTTIIIASTEPSEMSPTKKVQSRKPFDPSVKCTWKPSQKTKVTTYYYEYGLPPVRTTTLGKTKNESIYSPIEKAKVSIKNIHSYEKWEGVEETDGEDTEDGLDKMVLTLVKIHPPRNFTFGCVLTVVSEWWALTAASCLDAVGQVGSLASYGMVERQSGAARAVTAVRLHSLPGGGAHYLAALRSDAPLLRGAPPLRLPTMMDYLLLTVGERLRIIGFGNYRSPDTTADKRLRQVHVYSLPARTCTAAGQGGPPGLCAGPLHARGLPCRYCTGTPLLGGRVLFGVGAGGRACGAACEPAAYVNLAALRDWIDGVLSDRT